MNNGNYNKSSKSNNDVKEAIWKAYGKYCPICREYLSRADLTIDRIIPEDHSSLSAETMKYYNKLCEDGFTINCFENFMPMHFRENVEKGNNDLGVYEFQQRLLTAKSKAKMVLANLNEKKVIKKKDTLICQLDKLVDNDKAEAEFIYYYLTKQKCGFERKRVVTEGYSHYHCTFAEKNIAVFFNIPKKLKAEASCLLTFTSLTISGCLITFNQKQIHDIIFSSIKTDPIKESRKFILFPDVTNKEEYFVQLGNNRITLKIEELEQLCMIIDDLYDEYIKIFQRIEEATGTIEYEYNRDVEGYKLLEMNKQLWNLLFGYSWKYDWSNGKSNKHIFNKTGKQIQVNSPSSNEKFKDSIHTVLHPVDDGYSVNVYWKEGFSPLDRYDSLDIYNPSQKWRCNYTYEWLINEFIPNALYEDYLSNLSIKTKLLQKKLDFIEFRRQINYENLGVRRFTPSIYKLRVLADKMDLFYYMAGIENLIRNNGEYIYFEYDEIIPFLNMCNTVVVIFKNSAPDSRTNWSYFNINGYIDTVNSMYDKLESSKSGETFETYKLYILLKDTCEIINCSFINLSKDILEDIKLEIAPFDEAIKKIALIDKYKYHFQE